LSAGLPKADRAILKIFTWQILAIRRLCGGRSVNSTMTFYSDPALTKDAEIPFDYIEPRATSPTRFCPIGKPNHS
jgi:hypothetical protein